MKQIDIKGGYPLVVQTVYAQQRAYMARWIADWCAQNATAAWCLAPDHTGELEVTFANPQDHVSFTCALAAAI